MVPPPPPPLIFIPYPSILVPVTDYISSFVRYDFTIFRLLDMFVLIAIGDAEVIVILF